MQRVIDWADKLTGVPVRLAFPEAEIEFQEEDIVLSFRDEGESLVWFEAKMAGRNVVEWRSNLETGDIPELHVAGEGDTKVKMSMILAMDNTVAKCVRKFRSLMLFAAYYREEVERTRVVTRSEKPRKNGSARKGGNRRMLTVRRYTIGSEVLGELPRKYDRHTESWGVRGHYRTYKSGKTVWVRPYVKGELGKRSDKEYFV
jgi:hypothetical protein